MFITVFSQKGGVSKTTTTVNLAAALARSNRRGVIVDLDLQQKDAHRYVGSTEWLEWTDVLPKKAPKDRFVVVDTPPLLTEESLAALACSDLAVISVTTEGEALESLRRSFETIATMRSKQPDLAAVVVFTQANSKIATTSVIETAKLLSEWPVLDTVIPSQEAQFKTAFLKRTPLVLLQPKSKGALAYKALAVEIEKLFE